jgi:hypothetical protein
MMRAALIALALVALSPQVAPAEEAGGGLRMIDAAEADLEALKWTARAVVVFADSPADPLFERQMRLIAADPEELAERDVVVITDTDPAARSAVRTKLRPRGFSLVLIDKDGEAKLRKPLPWDVREITHAIDKFPQRRQEMLEQRPSGE